MESRAWLEGVAPSSSPIDGSTDLAQISFVSKEGSGKAWQLWQYLSARVLASTVPLSGAFATDVSLVCLGYKKTNRIMTQPIPIKTNLFFDCMFIDYKWPITFSAMGHFYYGNITKLTLSTKKSPFDFPADVSTPIPTYTVPVKVAVYTPLVATSNP